MSYNVINFEFVEDVGYIPGAGYAFEDVELMKSFRQDLVDGGIFPEDYEDGLLMCEVRTQSNNTIVVPAYLVEGLIKFNVIKHRYTEENNKHEFVDIDPDESESYDAVFKYWTVEPNVGLFMCSDGKERYLHTKLLEGKEENEFYMPISESDKRSDRPAYHPWLNLPPQRRMINAKNAG